MLYLPASQQILLANAKTGHFILVMICSIPIKFEILAKMYYNYFGFTYISFHIHLYTICQRSNFIFKNNK